MYETGRSPPGGCPLRHCSLPPPRSAQAAASRWQAARRRLAQAGLPLPQLLAALGRIHLALFYFGGPYYHWAHRVAQVRINPPSPPLK